MAFQENNGAIEFSEKVSGQPVYLPLRYEASRCTCKSPGTSCDGIPFRDVCSIFGRITLPISFSVEGVAVGCDVLSGKTTSKRCAEVNHCYVMERQLAQMCGISGAAGIDRHHWEVDHVQFDTLNHSLQRHLNIDRIRFGERCSRYYQKITTAMDRKIFFIVPPNLYYSGYNYIEPELDPTGYL